jgi:very-short-patch-repair endonuclease
MESKKGKKSKQIKKTKYEPKYHPDTRGYYLGENSPIYTEEGKPYKKDKRTLSSKKKKTKTNPASWGEKEITKTLKDLKIKFNKEHIFRDCFNAYTSEYLRFDFYLPEHNICIEYDGKQHFEYVPKFHGKNKEEGMRKLAAQQYRDKMKDSYCEQKGISLLRINYKDWQNIDRILKEYICHIG